MNRITSQDPGGTLRFAGTLNEAATVSIAGKPADVNPNNAFSGTAIVASGSNTIEVKATDYSNNTRTNTYSVSIAGSSKTLTYDTNGNQISDGARTFEWDAENRLLAINNGVLRSEFTYDGLNRRVRIVEKNNSTITSDTRFVWCGEELCEERDSAGATVTKRFFKLGEQQGVDAFLYTFDHLGSIRELVDASTATLRARYDYDPYGRATKLPGADRDASFTFTGHYAHVASGLSLTHYRAYDANIGRWLSEDPLGFGGGANLYAYVNGNPIGFTDPLGLFLDPRGLATAARVAITGATVASSVVVSPLVAGVVIGGAIVVAGVIIYKNVYADPKASIDSETANPSNYPPPLDWHSKRAIEKCRNNGCKPCIPPVGTIAYRLDMTGRPHAGVPTPHWVLFVMNQSPQRCKCFWDPIEENQGGLGAGTTPPSGTIPIKKAAGGGRP